MTLFDPEPYSSVPTKKVRKPSEPSTGTESVSDGSWFAISRRSGMVPFAHRLGRSENKYSSVTTRCGTTGRVVEHFEVGQIVLACDNCQKLGILTRLKAT